MSTTRPRTRFAPSPTGEMHLGNLRTALFSYLYAMGHAGVFLLRVEDTDVQRSRAEYVQMLFHELRWLGLEWQEGPETGGDTGPYFQAQRASLYAQHYLALESAGVTYPCFCSEAQLKLARKVQRAAGRPPRYPGTCAGLSPREVQEKLAAEARPTLRFRVPPGEHVEFDDLVRGVQRFATDEIGDFIIRRSDGTPAFFFSNAVDDALMGVSHVLRGEDHLSNTPRQLLILRALGLGAPAYGHLSLLTGDDGSPLSKRHGSRSVRELREAGFLPGAILNYLARLGHSYSMDHYAELGELAKAFSLEHLGKAPARFDETQLRHWQKEALAATPIDGLVAWFRQSTEGRSLSLDLSDSRLAELLEVVRDNIEMPADAGQWLRRLSPAPLAPERAEREVLAAAGSGFFSAALTLAGAVEQDFGEFAKAVGGATGAKGKALFMPLRVALTGVRHGPEMPRIWDFLGPELARARLQEALEFCRREEADAETV